MYIYIHNTVYIYIISVIVWILLSKVKTDLMCVVSIGINHVGKMVESMKLWCFNFKELNKPVCCTGLSYVYVPAQRA